MEIIRKELVLLVKRNQDIPQSLELSEFKSWERRSERELHEMIEPALARLRQDIANIRETFTAKDGRPDENSVPKEVIEIVEPLLATLRNEVKDVFEIIRQELSVLTEQISLVQGGHLTVRGEFGHFWKLDVPRNLEGSVDNNLVQSFLATRPANMT